MLGTSPNSEGIVYHAAVPIYWRIALWLNGQCANILALHVLRVKNTSVLFELVVRLSLDDPLPQSEVNLTRNVLCP